MRLRLSPVTTGTAGIVAAFAVGFAGWAASERQTEPLIGWTLYAVAGLLGVTAIGLLILAPGHASRSFPVSKALPIGHRDWERLAHDFKDVPLDVYASWSDGRMETDWYISADRSDKAAQRLCEALCRKGGAMLFQSPRVSKALSAKVRSRGNLDWRWLEFLKEREPSSHTFAHTVHSRGTVREHNSGTIQRLGAASVRVAHELAALELRESRSKPETG